MNLGKIIGSSMMVLGTLGVLGGSYTHIKYTGLTEGIVSSPKRKEMAEINNMTESLSRTYNYFLDSEILSETRKEEIVGPIDGEISRLNQKKIELVRDGEYREGTDILFSSYILRERSEQVVDYSLLGILFGGGIFWIFGSKKPPILNSPVDGFREEFERETG